MKNIGETINNSSANKWLTVLILLCIVSYGFVLRFEAVMQSDVVNPLRADARQYFSYAYNLHRFGTYSSVFPTVKEPSENLAPDAVRTPGYPLFLLPFIHFQVGKITLLNIALAQVLMSTLVIIAAFFMARILLPVWGALSSAALIALSPHLVNANLFILTESLFTFALMMSVWLFSQISRSSSVWLLLLGGFLIALSSLVRPSLQYFVICMAILFFLSFEVRQARKFLIFMLIGFALGYGPWMARNVVTLGKVSDDQLKINFLHHGIYPDFKYRDDPRTYAFPYRYDPTSKRISQSMASINTEIVRRFSEQTWRHLRWYLLGKPVAFWQWNIVQGMGAGFIYPISSTPYVSVGHFKVVHRIMAQLHAPIIILGMLGAFLVWMPILMKGYKDKQRFAARVLSMVLLYYTFIHMIGVPFPRYSIPLRPLVYIMAVFTLILVFKFSRDRLKRGQLRTQN
ncbi:ArnT family glycosyltransferase [Pseudomonadota bacterium]